MSFSPDGPAAGRWLSFAGDCRPCVQQRSFPLEQAAHRLPPVEQAYPAGMCVFVCIAMACNILRQREPQMRHAPLRQIPTEGMYERVVVGDRL